MDGSGPRIAINGFGRIGRLVMRALREADADVDLVGVNDLTDRETLAHLLRYDSVHGRYPGHVEVTDDGFVVDGDRLRCFSIREPKDLPWGELDVDVVVEASGHFSDAASLEGHLVAGAKRVVLTAPGEVEATIVRGVNDDDLDKDKHRIVGCASCTTNCLAVVTKVLDDAFGVEEGFMTTVHAATNDQVLGDSAHKDLRRARASLVSMIPTSTGAAKAVGLVLPHLKGKLDGLAVRVPTADVSLLDLTARLSTPATTEQVVDALKEAAAGPLAGLLACEDAPLVSIDFTHDPHSAIVDVPTVATRGNLVKLLAWYDNEWGYANRVAETVLELTE